MSIVILLTVFLIIVIFGVVLYFIYYKKKKEKPLEIQDKTKDVKECSRKFDIKDYVFDSTPIKGTVIKEKFELSPTTIIDKALLDEETLYKRGILKDEISNTIYPSINNGRDCLEYPQEIYIPAGERGYCDGYTDYSTGISDDCYKELWKNVGCGGDPFNIPGKREWNSQQTLETLKEDVNVWYHYAKIFKNPYHAQYCLPIKTGEGYCDGYTDYSTDISDDCYREIWKNAGCEGDPFNIPGKREWNSSQTLEGLKGDANTWYYYAKVVKNPYHTQYCK